MPEPSIEGSLVALAQSGAEFVVIGGVAVLLHGGSHLTYDLDVAHSRSRENARLVVAALAPYDPRPVDWPPDLPFVWDEQTVIVSTILTLDTDLGRIDFLAEPDGAPPFTELLAHADELDLGGIKVFCASIQDLIRMKSAAGRPKDAAAIAELESIARLRDSQ